MTARASRLAREVAEKWYPPSEDQLGPYLTPEEARKVRAELAALIDDHPLMVQVLKDLRMVNVLLQSSYEAKGVARGRLLAALAALAPEEGE